MALSIGDPAPAISTLDQHGARVTPDLNRLTVLYFYPMDDTPGCTKEACEFRDDSSIFDQHDAQIFGVSTDDAASHKAFVDKFALNFDLLTDTDKAVCTAYDVLGASGYAKRVTYLIQNNLIQKVFDPVNPVGHSAEVQAAIEQLER